MSFGVNVTVSDCAVPAGSTVPAAGAYTNVPATSAVAFNCAPPSGVLKTIAAGIGHVICGASFGVMVTVLIEIAAITPPVGFNLYVLKSVVPNTELYDVTAGSLIFVVPLVLGLVVLLIFPELCLFLPRLVR